MTASDAELAARLHGLDGRPYKEYQSIVGSYEFDTFTLTIDHVQGDPYATASRARIFISQKIAAFSHELYRSPSRQIALRDYLTRQFASACDQICRKEGTGSSGLISIDRPQQTCLDRTSCYVTDETVEVRFLIALPAQGRTILGKKAAAMVEHDLQAIVASSLIADALDQNEMRTFVQTIEDADAMREQLSRRGLAAFVANESILPRQSGINDRPLKTGIAFQSPASLRTTLDRPNGSPIDGMAIPFGVTVFAGGGFHGKSTVLRALERGVYNHVPGDGREFVVTDPTAVKIRAEDGRSVRGVCITPFISNLPGGISTDAFDTDNASGSTSQAANIIEAIEAGCRVLLLDEDTSATNFMIRDRRMQELTKGNEEPITAFVDRVRELHTDHGISTILVMGGCGDYLDKADTVITMKDYLPHDSTQLAKEIVLHHPTNRLPEITDKWQRSSPRIPLRKSFSARREFRKIYLRVREVDEIIYGTERIDLHGVEQLVDESQMRAIAQAVYYASQNLVDGKKSVTDILDGIERHIATHGLASIIDFPAGDLAMFRRFELAAAINRMRKLQLRET